MESSCTKCGKTFYSRETLRRHVKTVHDAAGANKVTCSLCQKSFASTEYLRIHKKTHKDPDTRKLACSQCDKVYFNRPGLRRHIREVHKGNDKEKPHACNYCEKKFWNSTDLSSHTRTHTGERPYGCSECKATFVLKSSRDGHVRNVHGEKGEATHSCPEPGCQKLFRNPLCLKQHLKTHSNQTYPCETCDKIYNTNSGLWSHVRSKHKGREKEHKCTYCDKAVASPAALVAHVRSHTGEKPYPCRICGRRFACGSDRQSHEAGVHTTERRHQCQQCGNAYKYAATLRVHLETHDIGGGRRLLRKPRARGVERASKEATTCPICGKTVRILSSHIRVHTGEKPYKCQECPAKFAQSGGLLEHGRAVHHSDDSVRAHACPITGCGKRFKTVVHLSVHSKRHSIDRIHRCVSCTKTFVTNRELALHVHSTHERQEMRHNCQYCEKQFGSASQLVAHMRTHTDERPYACNGCPLRFRQLGALTSHQTFVHGNERPHSCQQCEERFKSRGGLTKHMDTQK